MTSNTACALPSHIARDRCEHEVSCVTWHNKGDYLASVSLGVGRKAVMVHQVSKASTQCPFRKTKVRKGKGNRSAMAWF